jgi:hypothetical protein
MIERFSKRQFEDALPVNKKTGEKMWIETGFYEGEYTYNIPIFIGQKRIAIMIRSSIDQTGYAKDTGEDSIRLYFTKSGHPHGSKLSCYITRVKGWQDRLIKQLRIMYKRGMALELCPFCGEPKAMYKSKKDKSLFQACPDHFGKTYRKYFGE